MNGKQFRLALAIVGTVVAVSVGRHLIVPDHASGTDTQVVAASSGDVPPNPSPADLAAQQRASAEQMAVLGVIGKTFDAMRDQASMTVSSVGVVNSSKSITACLEYASKNGFGGMNSGYSVWQLDDAKVFRFSIDDAVQWNKHCATREMTDYTETGRDVLHKLKEKNGL